MTQTPTDALRLVPVEPTEAMIFAGVLAAMEAATEFMEDDFWKERHLAAIERMKSGDYGSDDERAKGVKVGSTLYRAMLAAAPASPLPEGGGTSYAAAGLDVLSRIRSRLNEQIERAEADLNSTVTIRLNDAKAIRHLLAPAAPTGDA